MAAMVLATRMDPPQHYGQGTGANSLEVCGVGATAGKEPSTH